MRSVHACRLGKRVFTSRRELSDERVGSRRLCSEFETVGPVTAKVRRPNIERRDALQTAAAGDSWQTADATDCRVGDRHLHEKKRCVAGSRGSIVTDRTIV